ncbi:MAG: 4Fe-4S dicluster domain-containing protein [Deltaproteobacteria bacterium]|nr:4Fe-4S dicluster domain-containing protein [Deltaproteobacteria bacterium]
MTWVITRLCRDCLDISCVDVCPVECIYEYKGDDKATFPNQLYIQPEECIDCGACEPECPWEAIYEDASVPEVFEADTPLNAKMMESQDDFEVPVNEGKSVGCVAVGDHQGGEAEIGYVEVEVG